jgi:hypothetical protein
MESEFIINKYLNKKSTDENNDDKYKNYKLLNITPKKLKELQDDIYKYNCLEKPFLMFFKEQYDPVIFKTSIFDDISKENEKIIIIDPDVCKIILGLAFSDYEIDFETVNLHKICEILEYLKFFKIKHISKNGYYHHYGVFDTNKNEQVIDLFTEEIYESYFAINNLNNTNDLKALNNLNLTLADDGYAIPHKNKKYKTIHITVENLMDEYGTGILQFLDIFTFSKIIYDP